MSRLTVVFPFTFDVGLILRVEDILRGETNRESAGAQGREDDGVEVHSGLRDVDRYGVSTCDC